MVINYDEVINHPTIILDSKDIEKIKDGEYLYSYDDGIAVIYYLGKIHILSEIPECTLLTGEVML
jgi:hypothetical protein